MWELTYEKELLEKGRDEGEVFKLIKLTKIKLDKGKTTTEIADDLEENTGLIERVIAALQAVEIYDEKEVYQLLMENESNENGLK